MKNAVVVFMALVGLPVAHANGQAVLRPSVTIWPMRSMEPLYKGDTTKVRLQWVCRDSVSDPVPPIGAVVARQKAVPGGVLLYTDTVKALGKKAAAAQPVTDFPQFKGQLYVDKEKPFRLRVNP